ncbi:MAG: hypothetical protein KBT32_06345 [Bacteroidales bacterium]|nr:hypothetical protein [Candidatus Physcocola equi]
MDRINGIVATLKSFYNQDQEKMHILSNVLESIAKEYIKIEMQDGKSVDIATENEKYLQQQLMQIANRLKK